MNPWEALGWIVVALVALAALFIVAAAITAVVQKQREPEHSRYRRFHREVARQAKVNDILTREDVRRLHNQIWEVGTK